MRTVSVGFFDEAPGVRSSMRLMAVMTLLAYQIYRDQVQGGADESNR